MASDAYDSAYSSTEPYSTRANHRYAILAATRALYKSSLDDSYAADTYDETVAAYTDPADFEAYTVSYLDAHTTAIELLTCAFDRLTKAFDALKPTYPVYSSAAALYKATGDTYTFIAAAYHNAAHCALTAALEGNLQAAKNAFELTLLEMRAANPTQTDPASATAKADAFKANAADAAAKAKALEEAAKIAESKAAVFKARAKAAEAEADGALHQAETVA